MDPIGKHFQALKHGIEDIRDVLVDGDVKMEFADYFSTFCLIVIVLVVIGFIIKSCVDQVKCVCPPCQEVFLTLCAKVGRLQAQAVED